MENSFFQKCATDLNLARQPHRRTLVLKSPFAPKISLVTVQNYHGIWKFSKKKKKLLKTCLWSLEWKKLTERPAQLRDRGEHGQVPRPDPEYQSRSGLAPGEGIFWPWKAKRKLYVWCERASADNHASERMGGSSFWKDNREARSYLSNQGQHEVLGQRSRPHNGWEAKRSSLDTSTVSGSARGVTVHRAGDRTPA